MRISSSTSASGSSSSTSSAERRCRTLAHRHLRLHRPHDREPPDQVGAQLVERLELGRLVRPLVVELGEHALLHLLDEHTEVDRIFLGIGMPRAELEDVAGLRAPQVIVELGHDAGAADFVEVVGGVETRRAASPSCEPTMSMVT